MKTIVYTSKAPDPIGPYSQAIIKNGTLYTSGQIAFNPDTGNLVLGNIEDETLQVMKNLQAVLDEAGYSFEDVVKTSIFISDMDNFANINSVYGDFFNTDTAPARETVQVARLPRDVNVEISMIAIK